MHNETCCHVFLHSCSLEEHNFTLLQPEEVDWDSSVGIATGYGLSGPGIESRCGRDFPHLSRPALAQPAYCTMGTGSFPRVKSGRGVMLTPHPLLVPRSWKSRAIPLLPLWAVWPVQSLSACTTVHFTFTYTSTPPMGRTTCTEPQCLYNGALYLYLYLYSPMGRTACTEPQCLYKRALYLTFYHI